MKNFAYLVLAILLTSSVSLNAEPNSTPILERKVTIKFTDEKIENILEAISEQADFYFSYSPVALPLTKKISVDFQDETVESVLNAIFESTVKYTVLDDYLVLQKDHSKEKAAIKDEFTDEEEQVEQKDTIKTPYEEHPEDKLPEAKDTEKISPDNHVHTDTVGYHPDMEETTIDEDKLPADTIKKETKPITDDYEPEPEEIELPDAAATNDTLVEGFQLSFFPGVGIDGPKTKQTIYNFSINILLGRVKGVNIMEFGGLGNTVKQNAGALQGAGIFNIVGGDFKGIQGAGVFNIVGGDFKGVQVSRVFNITNSFRGFQTTSVLNIVEEDAGYVQSSGVGNIVGGNFQGIQATGVFNTSKSLTGIQAAGVFNQTNESKGAQIAGVFNKATRKTGLQGAGVFNHADSLKGVQFAGVANIVDTINGAQLAGVFNRAHFFNGTQVGLINIADSCNGVPIGLFNYVRKGYHKLELSANERLDLNIAYRGGVKPFHTILTLGLAEPYDFDDPMWNFGVGIGTSMQYTTSASLEAELMSKTLAKGSYIAYKNNHTSIGAGIDWHISPNLSVYSGILFNMYIADTECEYYDDHFSDFMLYTLTDRDLNNNKNFKTWIGFKLGVRLF